MDGRKREIGGRKGEKERERKRKREKDVVSFPEFCLM